MPLFPAIGRRMGRAAMLVALLLAPAAAAQPAAPPSVTVSEPIQRQVTDWDDYTGRFAATERVEVRARVGGALAGVHFTDGQLVRPGDLLFTIDPRPYQAALAEVQGRLTEARSHADLTMRELGRANELRRSQAVPEATVDQRAEAVRSAQAAIAIAEAQLQRAALDLEWTRVVAPIGGRIGRHLVTPGNLVAGGDAGATLLATIVSIDPIDVYFDFDQASFLRYVRLRVDAGQSGSRDTMAQVMVSLGDETQYRHRGELNFVDNIADATTGTVRARARLANPNALFTPGIFARIRTPAGRPYAALLLPDSAIGTDQTRKVVFVLGPENRIAMREVQLGRLVDGLRVVREGLQATDVVVINGMQRVRVGLPVTPERKPILMPVPGTEPAATAQRENQRENGH